MFESSVTVYRVPRPHHHCHLENYDWNAHNEQLRVHVESFMGAWLAREAPRKLLLLGPPGLGKTHISVGIYRVGAFYTDLREAVYLHIPTFIQTVKHWYKNDGDDPWESLEDARLLIFDDMWGADLTQHEGGVIVPRLIETAYQNNASIVLTSNLSMDKIADKLNPHELSRLMESATVLNMSGADHRNA